MATIVKDTPVSDSLFWNAIDRFDAQDRTANDRFSPFEQALLDAEVVKMIAGFVYCDRDGKYGPKDAPTGTDVEEMLLTVFRANRYPRFRESRLADWAEYRGTDMQSMYEAIWKATAPNPADGLVYCVRVKEHSGPRGIQPSDYHKAGAEWLTWPHNPDGLLAMLRLSGKHADRKLVEELLCCDPCVAAFSLVTNGDEAAAEELVAFCVQMNAR